MQTLLAHSAFWRGVSLFAGMLTGRTIRDARPLTAPVRNGELVSWCAGARSRREDELARNRWAALD